MTPKAEFFGRIEEYCLEQLDAKEREEFEKELELNEDLREEVELHKNIQEAVTELDILNLRNKLDEIQKQDKPNSSQINSFELLDDLTEIEELKDELTPDELISYFDSLPKVHAYQHELTSNENIHHFYKEQNASDVNGKEDEDLNGFDMEGLDGLEEAVLEADILNLRDTLKQVAKSVEPQYSVEEIDEFINGEMSEADLAEFEAEFALNESLREEVTLHKEIEEAIEEDGVMDLRSELRHIMETETSWNVSEESIEDFIDGMLEEDLLEEFSAEIKENTDLMAEVALRENINEAIGETDIQSLRAELEKARKKAEKKEVKSIIMHQTDVRSLRFWRNSVAMILLLVGLAGVFNTDFMSVNKTYDKYFDSPTWASERSVSDVMSSLQQAQMYFQAADYQKVIASLNEASGTENLYVTGFYKGLSYQNLDQYQKAIREYQKVIDHGDNMFIEEAEWYKALCALKLGNKVEARKELLAVIDRKGHYEKDAKAILRRLRYSFK